MRALLTTAVFLISIGVAPSLAEGPDEAVGGLKSALSEGLAKARAYEWVETTVVSRKGEEKTRKQNRCYYGADGKVQKVAIDGGNDDGGGRRRRGVRGRVVARKKAEIEGSIKEAVGLVKSYLPPDPEKIQAAREEGRLSFAPANEDGESSITVDGYHQPGDSMVLRFDSGTKMLRGVNVNTFTAKKKDPVTLTADLAGLPDGAIYMQSISLDVTSEQIRIDIENTGHTPH